MAIIKCKMCGGDLNLVEGQTVAECEYCGSRQTVPAADNEKKLTLFARANRLRASCEFDKAAGIYESIVADFPEEAEAYWGLVLCKYGIEYVDDPGTGKKIPTCHRSSYDSVMDDSNFEQAMENADIVAQKVYREEAKQIERIRKGILEVSSKEQPYDIFICYKETAPNGDRTLDSVLAQDLYSALTDKGYRVFFSRITLQGKLGEAYEPYIFAALNSAKVMLAVGTCYEYYNAVWVKNEWSRYLKICEADKSKHLIPCYKNLDPEDMPKEFNHLQGADLGKMGAVQDILFNMEKYIPLKKQTTTVIQEKVVVGGSGDNKIASLLDRGNMALEDGDWAKADSFFEDVLNNDSKNAQAYLGKTLAQEKCRTIDAFVRKRKDASQNVRAEKKQISPNTAHIAEIVKQYTIPGYVDGQVICDLYDFDLSYSSEVSGRREQYKAEETYWANHKWLSKAEKFAVGEMAEHLQREKNALFAALSERVKKAEAAEAAAKKNVEERYAQHITRADAQAEKLYNDGLSHREEHYQNLLQTAKTSADVAELTETANRFAALGDYQDSRNLAEHCRKRAAEEQAKIDAEAERQRIQKERQEKERKAKNKKVTIISAVAAVIVLAVILVVTQVVIPNGKLNDAQALMDAGEYEAAYHKLVDLGEYKTSGEMMTELRQHADYLVTELSDEDDTYHFYYNEKGLPTQITKGDTQAYQFTYTYYPSGNLESAQIQRSSGSCHVTFYDSPDSRLLFTPYSPHNNVGVDYQLVAQWEWYRFSGVKEKAYIDSDGTITYTVHYSEEGIPAKLECFDQEASPITANGNTLTVTTWEDTYTLTMDDRGNITSVSGSKTNDYNTTYTYHGNGDTITKRVNMRGSKTIYEEIATTDANGLITGYLRKYASDGSMKTGADYTIAWEFVVYIEAAQQEQQEKERAYAEATALMESGKYEEAIAAFEALGDYKDSANKAVEAKNTKQAEETAQIEAKNAEAYAQAEAILSSGDKFHAAVAFYELGEYQDARNRSMELWDMIAQRETFSVGKSHTVGLKTNGTVLATTYTGKNGYSGQCEVSGWSNIVEVSAGAGNGSVSISQTHTVGLRADGTVVAVGGNNYGQCNVSSWIDIVEVDAGGLHTVGLKADGTVIAVGDNSDGQCDVSKWTDIVAVSAGASHTVGLKSDGTVVAVGQNIYGQCDVSKWADVVAVSAGGKYTVALRSDGTVMAVGDNGAGQCDVSGWTDIVSISAFGGHTAGLRSDGTVVAVGNNIHGPCDVSDWTDIVAISTGSVCTIGLKSDGTLVVAGANLYGERDVYDWMDIQLP